MVDTFWALASGLSWLYFAFVFLAALSAIHAVRNVRSAQGTVAWVVALLAFPQLALPLYWIFGRYRFNGYLEAIRDLEGTHKRSVEAVRNELATARNQLTTGLETPLDHLADVLDTPLSCENRFELLVNGEAFFERVLQEMRSAESYIYASFFIIRNDETGQRFADALIERARAGVVVRVLYDELGCWRLSRRYLTRLRSEGVEIRAFYTQQGLFNRFQLNFRNHRKLVVLDGRMAIMGGLNIGDEYLGLPKRISQWRDTAVAVAGPAARKVQAVFARDYYWAARRDLPEAEWSASSSDSSIESSEAHHPDPANRESKSSPACWASPATGSGRASDPRRGYAAVLATGPADARPKATIMFAAAANAARERLWISTPYLVPNETCLVALSMARARGVDVRLLIPSVADHLAVYLAGFFYEQELTSAGIDVYRYRAGLLHQKCVLVDHSLALIGSTNLDNRSLHLNFELMLGIEDPQTIDEVEAMLADDFGQADLSSEIPGQAWHARVGTIVARLFSPIL